MKRELKKVPVNAPIIGRIEIKATDIDDQGIFTGHAAVFGNVDSYGDIIEPGAFAESISTGTAAEGVLIFGQHVDANTPLGRSIELIEDNIGLFVKGQISDTTIGRDYRQLVKDGVLDRMSIGYEALEYYIDDKGIRHLTKINLYEISIVNFPANPEAKIQSYKQKGGIKKMGEETGTKEMGNITPEDLAGMLEAAAEAGAARALEAIGGEGKATDPAVTENEEGGGKLSEDETSGQKSDQPATETKAAPGVKMQRKYADIYMNRGAAPVERKSNLPPGIGWVRFQKSMMRAGKDHEKAAYIAKKDFGDEQMEREIKAMTVTSPTDGGYLVPEVYASEIIPLLRAKAVVLKLGATELPMDRGNINLPKQTGSVSAGYVGEGRKVAGSKASFSNLRLSSKKLMCKVLISNDLIRSNAYGADQLILNDATLQMALAMDRAALMGKGTEFEPQGLLNMAKISSVDINGAPNESTTGKMLGKLIQNNADTTKLGWAFNGFAWSAFYNVVQAQSGLFVYRDQMDQMKLNGHEFGVSNQLENSTETPPTTNVILGNWSEYIIGRQGAMESEMFREGTIVDASGKTVSAVDQDMTILRIIDLHDFGVRHEESFVIGKNMNV